MGEDMEKFLEKHPEVDKVKVRITPHRSYSTMPWKEPKNGSYWEIILEQGVWATASISCNHPNCQGSVNFLNMIEDAVRRKKTEVNDPYFQCTGTKDFSLHQGKSCPTAFTIKANIFYKSDCSM